MGLSEVPTFIPSLEGLQAEGTACSKAPHDKGLGRFPRVTEATLEAQSAWVARQNTLTWTTDTHFPVRRLDVQGQGNSTLTVQGNSTLTVP